MKQTKTRRDFLKVSGIGLGISAFAPDAIGSESRVWNEEERLGIAFVGLGYYAEHKLAPGVTASKYLKVAGIVTGTPEKEQKWMDKYGIPRPNVYNYDNFDSIADNKDIDIVYVVLPNSMHADFVIRAAKAGKHVICEKPFDIYAAKAKKAIDVCRKEGVLLQIGYRCQYDPYHMELMRLAKEKPFGAIKEIRSSFSFFGVKGDNWRYTNRSLAGGGPLMDVGIYCIQAARYASGEEPEAVRAGTYNTYKDLMDGMEETVAFTMEFPSGAIANISSSYASRGNFIDIIAENGKYGLGPAFGYNGAQGYIGQETFSFEVGNQQAQQMDAFARNILDGTPVKASGAEGLQDMLIVEAIYKSARIQGRRIML